MPFRPAMRLALLAALTLAFAGCDSASDPDPSFGDPYQIAAEPVPTVTADARLAVTVEYGGGCEEHDFVLRSRDVGGTVEVWFVHDGRGDTCEALLTDTLTAVLPGVAADSEVLALLTPSGDRIMLRAVR